MGGLTDEPWFPILAVAAAAVGAPYLATVMGATAPTAAAGPAATGKGASATLGADTAAAGLLPGATGIELGGTLPLGAASTSANAALTAAQAGYIGGPEWFVGQGAGLPIGPATTPLSAGATLFTPPADPSIWSQMWGNLQANLSPDKMAKSMGADMLKSALSPQAPMRPQYAPPPRRREQGPYQPLTGALAAPQQMQLVPSTSLYNRRGIPRGYA